MTDHQAIVATADATWALFWVTGAAAIATILAVIAAFIVPAIDRSRRKKEQDTERNTRRHATKAEVLSMFALMKKIEESIAPAKQPQEHELWTFLNRINVALSLLEYRLTTDLGDEKYPPQLLQTIQALYEIRDACDGLLPGKNWATHASGRGIAFCIVQRAQERCKDVIPALG